MRPNRPSARRRATQLAMGMAVVALGVGALPACQVELPKPATGPMALTDAEMALARSAWQYFVRERRKSGLIASGHAFPAITMWDVGSQLAGLVAARELGLAEPATFEPWMAQTLASLAALPLYHGELPNKVYHADTLVPLSYGKLTGRQEIGFSATDLGRLVRCLDLVAARHPAFASACQAVTARWNLDRLVKNGEMWGTDLRKGREDHYQEGRLGYEQYAAYGLVGLGRPLETALDARSHSRWETVSGVEVPTDVRETTNGPAHSYVISEPYILDGLESGFKALPPEFAARLLVAQEARFRETGRLTAWSEDNLDRKPYFLYNCLRVDGKAWTSVDAAGKEHPDFAANSLKAAVAWHVLFRTDYTRQVYQDMRPLFDPEQGAYAGRYEADGQPNRALTLNTNGIVLEAMLVAKVGRDLATWARSPEPGVP